MLREGGSSRLECPQLQKATGWVWTWLQEETLILQSVLQPDQTPKQRAHVCAAQVPSYEKLKTEAVSGR